MKRAAWRQLIAVFRYHAARTIRTAVTAAGPGTSARDAIEMGETGLSARVAIDALKRSSDSHPEGTWPAILADEPGRCKSGIGNRDRHIPGVEGVAQPEL